MESSGSMKTDVRKSGWTLGQKTLELSFNFSRKNKKIFFMKITCMVIILKAFNVTPKDEIETRNYMRALSFSFS